MISNNMLGLGAGAVDTIVGLAQGEGIGEALAGGVGTGGATRLVAPVMRAGYRDLRDQGTRDPQGNRMQYLATDRPNNDGQYSLVNASKRALYPSVATGAGMLTGGNLGDYIYNQVTDDSSQNNPVSSSSNPSYERVYNDQMNAAIQQAQMKNQLQLEQARALAQIEMEKRAQYQQAKERELAMQLAAQENQLQAEQDMLLTQAAMQSFQ